MFEPRIFVQILRPDLLTPWFLQATDVWMKDVWDFQALSQTSVELRSSLGNLKGGKDPHPQEFSLAKKTARFTKRQFRPY